MQSKIRLHIVDKQHYRTLKSLYSSHLSGHFNLNELPSRKLSEQFAKFAGYDSSNALIASIGCNPTNALSYGKEWTWLFEFAGVDSTTASELLLQQYAAHFEDDHGTPLKDSKLRARFCALYGAANMAELAFIADAFSSVKAYVVALSLNVSVQKDQILCEKSRRVNIDSHSRMAYQIPSSVSPTTATCYDLSAILAGQGGVFYSLFKELAGASDYCELYAAIKRWVSSIGIHFEYDLGDSRYFATEDCVYRHERINGNHWRVTIRPSSGLVTHIHLATALRQVNVTWDDIDARGKYDVDRLHDEVLNLASLGGNCSTVTYSSTFRGKAEVVVG